MQFPGLDGVLPGFGRQEPNDWGLGLELRDGKQPALDRSAQLAAHVRPLRAQRHVPLGRPDAGLALACLTDLDVRRLGQGRLAAARRRGPGARIARRMWRVLDGWRLCPRCGAGSRARDQGALGCSSCGSRLLRELGAGGRGRARARRQGTALEARDRAATRLLGPPGGFLEEGEEPLDGLAREFREETGLEVEPVEWLGAHLEPYDHYFVLGLTWLVRGDGEPGAADDVEELRLVRARPSSRGDGFLAARTTCYASGLRGTRTRRRRRPSK